ncbi:MAG: efflux RND transporter permease subunit [Leptospiraceae bacterium]|nr:efflux RND transporter permease subunit [Leptospiraceae bacterium]MCK6380287.1 efflux RND transporter permease subunit [Leptospiraceae bacterium]NUM41108.1 efflux RND transporter permease subunit [Leptospiraceae bacterium]
MIKRIITFSAENKVLTIAITLVLLAISYYSLKSIPLDAIPDLSDTQVIVYSKWDRSPDIIEDQVTYPIITSLLGAPRVKSIRGFSDFGFSYVYVIFQDNTDIYWARSRVLEYLSKIQSSLPAGVKTEIGPDATGVGWVFQYALIDKTGSYDLSELRSYQDFKLRYQLTSIPGVSEVAGIGGFKKQYQITVNPSLMLSMNIPMSTIIQKVRDNNKEIGARILEFSGAEYMVRGRGYAKSIEDFEKIGIGSDENGTPILLKNLAKVAIGPDMRRGISDFNGEGDAVGGIVIMRHGENALNVIEKVKWKIEEIKKTLPKGMEIVTIYDRSELIEHSISNLKFKLLEEIIIVSIVILIFLWHFPSAIIPILTIPISVLLSFIPLYLFGVGSNIMSLAGIAISIGVLVDGAIVEVENAYKKLEEWNSNGRKGDYHKIRLDALLEVGPSVFFSLLVISVAFIPIFTLVDQEGRLFKPLAYSKNFAMAIAALLAITLDPALRMLFTRMEPFTFHNNFLSKVTTSIFVGNYYPEHRHPISKILFRFYLPLCKFTLNYPKQIIGLSVVIVLLTIPLYFKLGSEFMPPLYEESLLYMPTTLPGISVSEAEKLMQSMDKKIKSFPEVISVFGKSGRADTSTDPAPFSMMETVILLKPEKDWREIKKERFYKGWNENLQKFFRLFIPDKVKLTKDELVEMLDKELQYPGTSNAWTMPIKARIDMLSTGVRTPIGIKIHGSSLYTIESIGVSIEKILKDFPKTRSVFAERSVGGYFLDIKLDREKLARYNLSVNETQEIILSSVGGEEITETIEGRERYSVNIRYPRDLRDSLSEIKRILVPISTGGHIPIGEIAEIEFKTGPAMIRDENGFLTGYVYVDTKDSDIGGYVEKIKTKISEEIQLPDGYTITWSGQYENMIRVRERLKIILPVTIALIFLLIYLNTKSAKETVLVLLAVPFSLIGAVCLLYFLNYQISVAVWVGMIALLGLDAETGVFMLLYLDLSYNQAKKDKKLNSVQELKEAILHGAVGRVRPKIMTVLAGFMGLLPIMWSTGAGSDIMKRIAAPMVGGLFTSFLLELLVYPPIYLLWKKNELKEK